MVNTFESRIANAEQNLAEQHELLVDVKKRLVIAESHESKELIDLAKLVADMRAAQQRYQRTGLLNVLNSARRRETEVDIAIAAILGYQQRPLLKTNGTS